MTTNLGRSAMFEPGQNCWRVERAARAAFLIDADAYFHAFVEAAGKARHSLLIAGWDFHSRTRLLCAARDGCELELGAFLNELVCLRRGLHVSILIWDYPMIFGLDREWGAFHRLGWRPRRRIHFRYDNTHPLGGSHHQKIVVVDDAVAFCGGIDLTCRRWDDCTHAPHNESRKSQGAAYPPMHDQMMAVEGDAASALGALFRERWRKATQQTLSARGPAGLLRERIAVRRMARAARYEHWPESLQKSLRDVDVAISRTEPAGMSGDEGIHEVEALYLDMIAAARKLIYIENQYFTADRVGEALKASLAAPEGPELIVVLRELSHGWLEELTMQTLRTRLIDRLRKADRHGRFHVFYPYIAGLEAGTCIDVHAKMIIVDNEFLRIGSANLANRSMGLDTECDLSIQARGRDDVRTAIREHLDALLAEHLHTTPRSVRNSIEACGSVRAAITKLHCEQRTLRPLEQQSDVSEAMLAMIGVADPEKPVALADLAGLLGEDIGEHHTGPHEAGVHETARHLTGSREGQHAIATMKPGSPLMARDASRSASQQESWMRRGDLHAGPRWGKLAVIALTLVCMAALWKFTPLTQLLESHRLSDWAQSFGDTWWAPLATIAAYVPAAFILFPRPLITLFAVLAFGSLLGFAYAMLGIELSAWLTFVIGRRMDHGAVRRLAGRRLHDILQVLRRRGLLAITALRLVPLAPFAVEGVVAGAVRVKLWHFLLGTAIGILPGTLVSTLFGDQLQLWFDDPEKINYGLLAGMLLVLAALTWLVRRWLMATSRPVA